MRRTFSLLTVTLLALSTLPIPSLANGKTVFEEHASPLGERLTRRPNIDLVFEQQMGQLPDGVFFRGETGSYVIDAMDFGFAVTERRSKANETTADTFEIHFGDSRIAWAGQEKIEMMTHETIGNDPANWYRYIPNFATIKAENVYPSIDVVAYFKENRELEFDFEVRPGGDPNVIRMASPDSDSTLTADGSLIFSSGLSTLKQSPPYTYQDRLRTEIPSHYVDLPEGIGIEVGAYNPKLPLIIDPTFRDSRPYADVGFSELAEFEGIRGFVAVGTSMALFGTPTDAYLLLLSAELDILVKHRFGGTGWDGAHSVTVRPDQSIAVSGTTKSSDFPKKQAVQGALNLGENDRYSDAFITVFDVQALEISFSSYFGGSNNDDGLIRSDSVGNLILYGQTSSEDLFTKEALYPEPPGDPVDQNDDLFIAKVDPDVSEVTWSTYFGSSGYDYTRDFELGSDDSIYLIGRTKLLFGEGTDFPTTHGDDFPEQGNLFIAMITPTGQLGFSRVLGGSGEDNVENIIVLNDQPMVIGETSSEDLQMTNAFDDEVSSGLQLFVIMLDVEGVVVLSSYLGSEISGIGHVSSGIDAVGLVFVLASTSEDYHWFVLKGPYLYHSSNMERTDLFDADTDTVILASVTKKMVFFRDQIYMPGSIWPQGIYIEPENGGVSKGSTISIFDRTIVLNRSVSHIAETTYYEPLCRTLVPIGTPATCARYHFSAKMEPIVSGRHYTAEFRTEKVYKWDQVGVGFDEHNLGLSTSGGNGGLGGHFRLEVHETQALLGPLGLSDPCVEHRFLIKAMAIEGNIDGVVYSSGPAFRPDDPIYLELTADSPIPTGSTREFDITISTCGSKGDRHGLLAIDLPATEQFHLREMTVGTIRGSITDLPGSFDIEWNETVLSDRRDLGLHVVTSGLKGPGDSWPSADLRFEGDHRLQVSLLPRAFSVDVDVQHGKLSRVAAFADRVPSPGSEITYSAPAPDRLGSSFFRASGIIHLDLVLDLVGKRLTTDLWFTSGAIWTDMVFGDPEEEHFWLYGSTSDNVLLTGLDRLRLDLDMGTGDISALTESTDGSLAFVLRGYEAGVETSMITWRAHGLQEINATGQLFNTYASLPGCSFSFPVASSTCLRIDHDSSPTQNMELMVHVTDGGTVTLEGLSPSVSLVLHQEESGAVVFGDLATGGITRLTMNWDLGSIRLTHLTDLRVNLGPSNIHPQSVEFERVWFVEGQGWLDIEVVDPYTEEEEVRTVISGQQLSKFTMLDTAYPATFRMGAKMMEGNTLTLVQQQEGDDTGLAIRHDPGGYDLILNLVEYDTVQEGECGSLVFARLAGNNREIELCALS